MAYIALFDILGFKQAILETPLNELKKIMGAEFSELLDMTVSFKVGNKSSEMVNLDERTKEYCSYIRFSDTVLLFSDETDLRLGHILLAARKLINFMMLKGLPVRGVITRGELHVDFENTLVLGEGLIRAYELEQIQEWSGAFIDPDRIEVPHDLYDEYRNISPFWERVAQTEVLFRYETPFKKPQSYFSYVWCIAWPIKDMPMDHLVEILSNSNPLTDESKPKTLSAEAKIKIDNTIKFFDAYKKWYDDLWFFPNIGVDGGWFQHTTCHVCDQGTIKYPDGCPGCGNVSGKYGQQRNHANKANSADAKKPRG